MATNRIYNTKALTKNNLYLVNYSPERVTILNKVKSIIYKYTTGIHIIAGMRGAGKSTFLNVCMDEYKDKMKFLHLNVIDSSFDLVSELTIFLDNLINLELKKINNYYYKDENLLYKIKDYNEKISKLKHSILNDILIKKSFDFRIEENEKNKLQQILGVSLKNFINLDLSNQKDIEENIKNEVAYEVISTPIQKKEKNIKNLINILKEVSKDFGIVVILDEIDKMSDDEFEKFIEKNKELFLESELVYFLVCDAKKYLNVRYNHIHPDIFNQYIYIPLLSWREYLIVAPKINEIKILDAIKMSYCYTIGNYRRIVTFHKDDFDFRKYSKNYWKVFNEIESSNYYDNLPQAFKDIVKEFIFDILIELEINMYLTENELNRIKERYSFIPIISNCTSRIIELIQKSDYINYSEEKYILCEENVVSNENLLDHRDSLEDEILKLYPIREKYISSNKRYRLEELSTSEFNDLLDIIVFWKYELDAALIFKEKSTKTNINDISYNIILLVDNMLFPTAFINSRGFAWNHECGSRYERMKEYIKKHNILFKEYELKEDEDVYDVFQKRQKKYIEELSELSMY